jgi:hypothetical protein
MNSVATPLAARRVASKAKKDAAMTRTRDPVDHRPAACTSNDNDRQTAGSAQLVHAVRNKALTARAGWRSRRVPRTVV